MFTGIIECVGIIKNIEQENENFHFQIASNISAELKIDQSLAHNGVCLTVTSIENNMHQVTAIAETMHKTNLGTFKIGDSLNLERCMQMNGRIDGHIVQGHVDQTGKVTQIQSEDGSWRYTISYDPSIGNVTVEKGSICVNGISLTVVDSGDQYFSVAIIPYTYENTTMKHLKVGDTVNLEFDIIGKYVARMLNLPNSSH
jgi:riboflavin synthase